MRECRTFPLGDVCTIVGGATPSKSQASFYNGDILWATVRDMNVDVITDTEHKITQGAVDSCSTNIIPANNVVIASRVGLGKVCLTSMPTAINQDLRGVLPKSPERLSVHYLYRWFQSVADQILGAGRGATVQGVTLPFLKSLLIPVPPLPEQQRIVGILDQAFEGIAKAKANAERNLVNAKELFESELEEVFSLQDASWDQATLSEVCNKFGRGKSRHRPRNDPSLYGGDYPFIQTGDVRNSGDWITAYSQTYNEKGLAQSLLWPKGTLCITIAANIAEIGILDFDACFPDSIIGCVVNEERTSKEYLCYVLRYYQAHLKAQGKGSAQDNINLATFENQKFPFPSLAVQDEIVEKLNSIWSCIEAYEANRQSAISGIADLRQSILHQAFSGNL